MLSLLELHQINSNVTLTKCITSAELHYINEVCEVNGTKLHESNYVAAEELCYVTSS